jgi:hypothetical protein
MTAVDSKEVWKPWKRFFFFLWREMVAAVHLPQLWVLVDTPQDHEAKTHYSISLKQKEMVGLTVKLCALSLSLSPAILPILGRSQCACNLVIRLGEMEKWSLLGCFPGSWDQVWMGEGERKEGNVTAVLHACIQKITQLLQQWESLCIYLCNQYNSSEQETKKRKKEKEYNVPNSNSP